VSPDREPTVLVTGGSSRIGRSIVANLGSSVRYIFLLNERPAPIAGSHVRTLTGGLAGVSTHADAVRSADVVLHVAGVSHARHEDAYMAVNDRGTRALLQACRKTQPIVYLSTRCAAPHAGAYGRSKYNAEQAIVSSGQPYVIIRPSEVYGAKAGEGIDALLDVAARWRVLVDFSWSPEVRYSPVSCEELARFVADVVRSDLSGAAAEYTVCNNRSYTAREIQAALQRGLGKRIVRMPVPLKLLKEIQTRGLPLPFAPDQIDRLVAVKPDDNRPARRDYSFSPRCFLEYLEISQSTAAPDLQSGR
jgi:nucleoside-diphosphate-sugar epimerase